VPTASVLQGTLVLPCLPYLWEDRRGLGFIVIPPGKFTAGQYHGWHTSEYGWRMRFISSEELPPPGLESPAIPQNFSPAPSN